MTDASSTDSPVEIIGSLIDSFFAALKDSPDLSTVGDRPAEIAYELDQVVSSYLEEHELSADAYHQIEQDVLNTIAADLHARDLDQPAAEITYDADGNADPVAVLSALDGHFDALLSLESPRHAELDAALDTAEFGSDVAADFPVDPGLS